MPVKILDLPLNSSPTATVDAICVELAEHSAVGGAAEVTDATLLSAAGTVGKTLLFQGAGTRPETPVASNILQRNTFD